MALQKKIHDFHRQKHQLFRVQCEEIWKVINGQLVVNWWELGPGTLGSRGSPDEREDWDAPKPKPKPHGHQNHQVTII